MRSLSIALARSSIATTRALLLAPLCALACGSMTPEPAEPTAPGAQGLSTAEPAQTPAASAPATTPAPAAEGAPPAEATNEAKATGDAKATGPSACPEGMQLVEGEYCTEVEQVCKKSWYDESNKKTICEVFESPSRCIGEKVKKRYCIDTYEWPNEKGERPEVMNRFHQAEVKCAAVGKRMCTESEWTLACEGPELKPYPYGYTRDANKCHGDVAWDGPNMEKVAQRDATELARLWKGVRSGSQPECISDYGVADLPGNADEVVASETFEGGWRGKFDSVHSGGPWYKGVRNQCRPKIYTHDEGFYYYFLSFRCCAEPDGAPTDPRTPKQRKENWSFDRVERIAGVTVKEAQEALEKKAQGKCECKERDTKCKTLCGTLLGPEAKDYK